MHLKIKILRLTEKNLDQIPIYKKEIYQFCVRYISRADVKYCYVTGDFCHIPRGLKMSQHHQFIDSNFIQTHKTSKGISS